MPNTTVRAAAEGMPSINRRRAIFGAGATAAALAVTSLPAEPAESEILTLFREWHWRFTAEMPLNTTDEEADAFCKPMNAAGEALLALPATNAAEFAAKFLVASGYGAFDIEREPLFLEAHGLLGINLPYWSVS